MSENKILICQYVKMPENKLLILNQAAERVFNLETAEESSDVARSIVQIEMNDEDFSEATPSTAGSEEYELSKSKKYKKGAESPPKPFMPVRNCCKFMCFEKVPEEDQRLMYAEFSEAPKGVQDVHLSGLMQCRSPATYKVVPKRKREFVWRYAVLVDGEEIVCCQKFLLHLYQISEKRLRVVQEKSRKGESFGDRRGRHGNRPGSINSGVWELAKQHLNSIPATQGLDGTEKRYFKDSTLNVKKIYDMFRVYYEQQTGKELVRLAYKTYHKYFTAEQKYGFLSQLVIPEEYITGKIIGEKK